MNTTTTNAIISRTAHELAIERPDGVPAYLARDAAREIKPDVGITIRDLVPVLQSEASRIARLRAERARRMKGDAVRAAICERYQQCEVDADVELRRALRRLAGCDNHDSAPVQVVWGTDAPQQRGESYIKYHWQNGPARGTVYHPSTRRVEVGVGWLVTHLGVLLAAQAA